MAFFDHQHYHIILMRWWFSVGAAVIVVVAAVKRSNNDRVDLEIEAAVFSPCAYIVYELIWVLSIIYYVLSMFIHFIVSNTFEIIFLYLSVGWMTNDLTIYLDMALTEVTTQPFLLFLLRTSLITNWLLTVAWALWID